MNASPALASTSLVFLRARLGPREARQLGPAAGPPCCASLLPPPPRTSPSPAPPRPGSGSPAVSPAMVPSQTSPPARPPGQGGGGCAGTGRGQLPATHPEGTPRPPLPRPRHPAPNPRCQPNPRAAAISEIAPRTLFPNQQHKGKEEREAEARVAQASPTAAAAGLLTGTPLTSARLGFCEQLVLLFFPQTKSVLAAKSSCPGGEGRGVSSTGKTCWQGLGRGWRCFCRGCSWHGHTGGSVDFCASKTFRVTLQK